jgi:hypothetical protein
LECLEAEEKPAILEKKLSAEPKERELEEFSRIYRIFDMGKERTTREVYLDKELTGVKGKHQQILGQAKAIFSIAINCLQHLHSLKDVSFSHQSLGQCNSRKLGRINRKLQNPTWKIP